MLHALLLYRLDVLCFVALAAGGMAAVHVWLRRRGTAGVRPAAWTALVVLVAGAAAVAEHNGRLEADRLRDTLEGFAPTYAQELERMGHAAVSWDTPPDDPEYLAMIDAQCRWLRANRVISDVYTFRLRTRADGRGQDVAFVVDSETDYDRDGRIDGERERRTPIGERFPEADENMAAALTGRATFAPVPVTDRWGTWVSAYVPLYDSDGGVEAALGIDYDARAWSVHILSQRGAALGAALVLVVVLTASTASGTALRAEVDRRTQAERALSASEERARVVVETALDAVVTVDAAGAITGWNRQAETVFGWPAAEAVGRPLADTLIPERLREAHRQGMRRYLATGSSKLLGTRFEITALRRDGTPFPIEISIAPVRAAGAVAFSAFIRDITERRRGEEALRHSEERFRLAAQCASDSIYEVDLATGRLEWFGHDTLGFGALTPSLETWERAIHPEDRARVIEAFDRTVKTGEPFREAYRLLGAGGAVLHVTDRGALIRDAAGGPRLVIGVVTDVTREVHTQALEAEKASLKRSVVSMEQVLGVVAHELRTPLAGVRAMSEFLLDHGGRDAAQFDNFLRDMNHEVVRMAETVNNLLEAARLNSGRAKWNWSTFRVADVCREALDRVRPLVEGAAVDLSSTVSPDDLEVAGDPEAVGRLLLNLLSNAVRHTPAGSVTLTAQTQESEGRRWLELSVADTGAGIAPEILDRLGEPFALNAGIVGPKHVAGTGLGLAICRGIVAAHGGEMHFESRIGQGTRVVARLRADLPGPAAPDASTPAANAA